MFYEQKKWKDCYFLTLLEDTIPYLDYSRVQLFIKVLREHLRLEGITLRYLCCCEYGKVKHKPHYHLILWLSDTPSYPAFEASISTWSYGNYWIDDVNNPFAYRNRGKSISALHTYVSLNTTSNESYNLLMNHVLTEFDKGLVSKNFSSDVVFEAKLTAAELLQKRKLFKEIDKFVSSCTLDTLIEKYCSSYHEIPGIKAYLVKRFVYRYRERILCSIGLGFDEFLKEYLVVPDNKKRAYLEGGVYIDGFAHSFPFRWIRKLADLGFPSAQQYHKAIYEGIDLTETMLQSERKRTALMLRHQHNDDRLSREYDSSWLL